MQRAVRSDEVTDAVQRRGEAKGLALGFVGVAIFGLTLPMMRIALTGLDPIFVGLGRAILAAVVAALVLAGTRQPFPSRETWPRLVVISLGVIFGFPLRRLPCNTYPLLTAASCSRCCRSRQRWQARPSPANAPRLASG
jgi:hypothetical protein